MSEPKTLSSHEKTVRLTTSAVMIALSTVLSMITLYRLPQGGALTPVSMLPVCMISVMYGVKWGMGTSLAYAFIQMMLEFSSVFTWGLSKTAIVVCFLFDYILAFSMLGLAGIFRSKGQWGIAGGTAFAIFLRFVCHLISGATVFSIWMPEEFTNPWVYALVYCGSFMLPELILTTIATFVLTRVPIIQKQMTV